MIREEAIEKAVRIAVGKLSGHADPRRMLHYWLHTLSVPTIDPMVTYSNGILFNHESPIRGETFVTRKITRAVAAIHHKVQDCLYLGNLDSIRDWGHARDYVKGMWMMMQQPKADDYVLATGEVHSVREFVERAFDHVGVGIDWRGQGVQEEGVDRKSGRVLIKIDPRYFRPTEVEYLQGDASKAKRVMGWTPEVSFGELVRDMLESDLKGVRKGHSSD